MKVFVVICAVILFAAAQAHPHHHHGPDHENSSSGDSNSSSGDCEKPPPPPAVRPELQAFINDLKDFYALYPIDEIKEIVQAHLADPELQATIAFLRSDEFEDLVEAIAQDPDIQAVGEYLANANWPWAERMLKTMMQQRKALRLVGKYFTVTNRQNPSNNHRLISSWSPGRQFNCHRRIRRSPG